MGDEFDPYLRWLGIRADERPPNHYALLGVQLFEYDPEVLANAADRQMAHVRTFQSGKHSAESQRLLNELAAAKICLLDPERKAEYDAQVRQRLREAELAAVGTVHALSAVEIAGSRRSVAGPAATLLMVILLALGLTALGIVAVKMTSRHDEPAPPRANHPESPPHEEPPPREWADRPPRFDEPIDPFSIEEPLPPDQSQQPSEQPDRVPTEGPVAPKLAPEPVETPQEPQEPPRVEPPWEPPERPVEEPRPTREAKKPPLPDKAAREAARKAIYRQFSERYQRANNPNELRGLAVFLFQQTMRREEDNATRYVLLEEATTIAMVAGAGHAPLQRAASTIAEQFDVSRDEALVELVRHAADQPMTPAACAAIVTNTVSLAGEDIRNEEFEHARALLDIVHELARKSKNPTIVRHVVDAKRDLDRRQEAHAAFVAAAETLASSPDDPKANRMRGFYYCFYRDDWATGCKHLIKGDRIRLKRLAELDDKAARVNAEALTAGDAWWDAADKLAESAQKDAYRGRAEHWYRQALNDLSGPEKKRVEQRLEMSRSRR
ncbi:MAG TPA: hypothetical protein DD670_16555 [Planctomycetaceae bacterium]|nr:hypothetical protein [Planctomycetaceae bacterium]